MIQRSISPRQYAKIRGIAPDKVLFWIQTGQLKAISR